VHDGAKLQVCSTELAHMFGAPSPTGLVGRDVFSFVAPETMDESMAAVLSGQPGSYRSTGVRLNGTRFPIIITSAPVRYRGTGARLVLVRDLSPIALVVDDEPAIARMTAFFLRASGYQTGVCTHASHALADYEPGAASVIVTDISMPDIGGIAMVERIRQVDPEAPVVFMSGYSTDEIPRDSSTVYLPKPFTQDALKNALAGLPERARRPLE
jgi:CheY-like chemotaxis protein